MFIFLVFLLNNEHLALSITFMFLLDFTRHFCSYSSRQKSWDTLHFFILHLTFIPLLPPNNVVFVRSTCGNGKISRAQQCVVSHRRNNSVLGEVGVRVRYKDEEVERTMVFYHIFVSVPRTFGDYCTSYSSIEIDS